MLLMYMDMSKNNGESYTKCYTSFVGESCVYVEFCGFCWGNVTLNVTLKHF